MGQMSRSILVVFLLAFACVTQAHLISSRESHSTSSPDFQEKEVASHIASKIQECIGQCPKDHGILVQIQDLSSDASTRASTEDGKEKDWKSRGFCESVGKGWDSMPFDQRLGVASSIVATLTGPLYMMNSVSYTLMHLPHRSKVLTILSSAFLLRVSASTSMK